MSEKPLVGIIMGSDSDLPVMSAAAAVLEEFGVAYELSVVSAHRTPARAEAYAKGAADRGLRVIIAGAGVPPFSRGDRRLYRVTGDWCPSAG